MVAGGATKRLIRVFTALFSWMPGGLALVTVLICAMFTWAGSGLTMDMPNSGHPVQFMNFSHYFNNNVGGGLSGRGAGGLSGPASLRR